MSDLPLRIAQVSEHASPLADDIGSTDSGGQNVYVRELSLALAARGHHVTVYTRRTSPRQPRSVPLAPGVDVVHIAAGPARELPKEDLAPLMGDFGAQLALHWRDHAPDLVHAHYWMSGIAALSGARRGSIPVVTTFHALGLERIAHHPDREQAHRERERERERERVGSERTVAHIADAVIALTPLEVEYLTRAMGVPPEKIAIVPVGVNTEHFTPDGPAMPRTSRLRLVATGRLVERKGVRTVLAAHALLDELDVELLIAGGPAPEHLDDDPAVIALRAHAGPNVTFLGRVPHARVPELLRSADAYVCAPYYEPFGTAALEAAACGLPVVAPSTGGLATHIRHDTTGHLIPHPATPDALAAALRHVLTGRARRAALADAAAAHARAHYSWPHVTGQILAIYRSLLQPAG
ncbi:glycosyltransferase [Actinocorallia sp. A-T 12471]|uniref:glycosyltransferase n=1 Tax=Actinocorallia sp. A-T 12471 TaxID=3089813 RepID=UPI0029D23660|nr:glycosyltransferase [Actinocorallia sp. A-T 12471]MDX6740849.1 glycosyltransferase [Actinocorallia sp. A-T 12471]